MKFGIFYEHQLPRPWEEGSELQLIQDALEQVELADRMGFDVVLGGRAPLPRGVLALERPRGLPRRGQPADEGHPARPRHRPDRARSTTTRPAPPSASRCSTSSSGGRVEFGSGESSSEAELGGFRIDPRVKRERGSKASRSRSAA